jgi:hypothetical protein
MTNTKQVDKELDVAANSAAQDSKTQPSADEQKKNIPQSTNAAGENKPINLDQVENETQDASQMDEAQIIQAMQNLWKKPEELSKQRENIKVKMHLATETIIKLRAANKLIPALDKRIYSVPTTTPIISTDVRKLNELKIIGVEKERVNLREKDRILLEQFVRAVGSDKAALQYEKMLSQAKSKSYHRGAGYFIKKMILQVLNKIIKNAKNELVDVKKLAEDLTNDGVKLFNGKMRDLLEEFDEKLVIRCSHYNRGFYYQIIRMTLSKWNPETESEITELIVPDDSEQGI